VTFCVIEDHASSYGFVSVLRSYGVTFLPVCMRKTLNSLRSFLTSQPLADISPIALDMSAPKRLQSILCKGRIAKIDLFSIPEFLVYSSNLLLNINILHHFQPCSIPFLQRSSVISTRGLLPSRKFLFRHRLASYPIE
jgi:hypothetical protein